MQQFNGLGFSDTQALKLYFNNKAKFNKTHLMQNRATFSMYFNYLLDLSTSRFKWEGLPDELKNKEWFIENRLSLYGLCILFKEPITGKLLFLPATPEGELTLYGDYNSYLALGSNGMSFSVKKEDCVLFYDTINRTNSTIIEITEFANRIGDLQRTEDVRLDQHKTPTIFSGDKNSIASVNAFIQRRNENEGGFVVDEEMVKLANYKYEGSYLNNEIEITKDKLINEFCQMQGINSNPQDGKKQRMIVDEVNSNNERIEKARESYLKPRLLSCIEANEKFNLNLKVSYNEQDIKKEQKQEQETEEKEVV